MAKVIMGLCLTFCSALAFSNVITDHDLNAFDESQSVQESLVQYNSEIEDLPDILDIDDSEDSF
ncbi:MAG: hypothetical protein HOE90_16110 [Bacteriovoracaceae bacterium]|jgi:hypothetical protein|nr:hypothetical protein [Bacteriovoracaceae bacterium]